jgi:hypothetical protein
MADGRGGYRRPANPAPVSGPGQLSRRTDGAQPVMPMTGGAYGDATDMQQLQAGAPMAQVPSLAAPTAPTLQDATQHLTPLGAPSVMPQTPVTDGAAMGPGQGVGALQLPTNPNQQDAASLARYLPTLIKQANDPKTPDGYKTWVRNIIANLK